MSGGGESADSSPPVSATPTLGVPNAPTGLAANAGDNQVALNWTAPAIGSPTSYNVKRSTASGGPYTNIIGTTTAPTTSYMDTTAVNGTTYYYVVSGVNATGEGANSTEANATPSTYTGAYEPFDYPVGDTFSQRHRRHRRRVYRQLDLRDGRLDSFGSDLHRASGGQQCHAFALWQPAIREPRRPALQRNQVDQLSV